MRIGELRRVLAESGVLGEGGEPAPAELADALWLAALRRAGRSGPALADESPPARHAPGEFERPGAGTELAQEPEPVSSPVPPVSSSAVPRFPVAGLVPVPRPVPRPPLVKPLADRRGSDSLALARALRPLRRRVPSAGRFVLDEEMTAYLRAEQRLWLPALVPDSELAFDLALVVDDSESMALWAETVTEFRRVCERIGAFRDVRVWRLGASGDGTRARPVLRGLPGSSRVHDERELIDPAGRRIILVITDGVRPAWRPSGPLRPVLARWALAGPLAIVQPFPQRLWDRSPLHTLIEEFRPGWPGSGPTIRHPGSVAVPVLELSPTALRRWAQVVCGASGLTPLPAVALPSEVRPREVRPWDDAVLDPAVSVQDGDGEHPVLPDPVRLVQNFRASVSPAAYQLAGYLSAVPLSLPVMRLVQQSMMPWTGPAELAEVFLSGLLRKPADSHPLVDPESMSYVFAAGVREVMQSTLTRAQALSVLDHVGRYLVRGRQEGRPSAAHPHALLGSDDILAAAEQFPVTFGRVAGTLLERVAGPSADGASIRRLAGQLAADVGGGRGNPAGREPGVVLGIDLGATRSRMAYVDDTGRPVVVKSALGGDSTPSAVFFESSRHAVVGRAARDSAVILPDLVAQLVKRDMGTATTYTFWGQWHTPETVSALILRELARVAAAQSGHPVREVVITVPAYFGIAEREATRRAGELAGLIVADVLDEPIAAAIHYMSVSGPPSAPKNALVCDLGGGAFDATVIRLAADDVTVVCIDGDARLGGADWDKAIAGFLLDRLERERPGLHPEQDPGFMQDLLVAAERLKKELGSAQSRRHLLRFGGRPTAIEFTRTEVEELTAGLLDRVAQVVDRIIVTARANGVVRFDEVLLVGGMSRFPAVVNMLRTRLGVEPKLHEPELAVAKGAALYTLWERSPDPTRPGGQGAATPWPVTWPGPASADTAPGPPRPAPARVAGAVPRALGVLGIDANDPLAVLDPMRARRIVVHLLLANTPLPADTGPYTFVTTFDDQRVVEIEVWEQVGADRSDDLAANRRVGRGVLRDLPPRLPSGSPVEVTFFMSEAGQLTVHAKEQQSGGDVRFELQIGDFDSGRLRAARRMIAGYEVDG
jgi:molecular chaperone DnaK (HSP70)